MDKNFKDFRIIKQMNGIERIMYSQRQCENFMAIVDKEGIDIHYYVNNGGVKVYHEIILNNNELERIKLEVE